MELFRIFGWCPSEDFHLAPPTPLAGALLIQGRLREMAVDITELKGALVLAVVGERGVEPTIY